MTDRPKITSERERVTCFLCRRRRPPEKMIGTRCSDREACLRAMGRHVSSAGPTEAEKAAIRAKREGWANR